MYPPNDDTESAAFDVALATANTNRQWADTNVDSLNDWFADHTDVLSGSLAQHRSGDSVRLSSSINNKRRHLVMSSSDLWI